MVSESDYIRAGMLGFRPHESFDMHAHMRSAELFYFVRGTATYTCADGSEVPVGVGDLIMVEPGEMHVFRAGADGLIVLAVVAPNVDDSRHADGHPGA